MTKFFTRITFPLLLAICWLFSASSTFAAEPIVVTSLGDGDSGCTLRKAIQAANQNRPISPCPSGTPGHDTITFASNLSKRTINLQQGELYISEDVTIIGDITINANHRSRIFAIGRDLNVTMQDLTLVRGFVPMQRETSFPNSSGGAIAARATRLKIVDVTFSNNRAAVNGGAIAIDAPESYLTIVGGAFYQNSAEYNGGAIWLQNGGGTIHHSTFVNNHAAIDGGAIAAEGNLNIQDASFDRNIAAGSGGAIASDNHLTITRVRFTANQVNSAGGHIYKQFGSLTINDSTLRYGNELFNDTNATGGAIFAAHSDVSIYNSDIYANRVTGNGGGLYVEQGSLSVRSSKFRNNSSLAVGGGAYLLNANATINDSFFIDNQAHLSGGGLYAETTAGETNVAYTVFRRNHAQNYYGGGMLAVDGQLHMSYNSFFNNSAKDGGGLFLGGTDNADLVGLAFDSNYARETGGGIAHHGQVMTLRESTFHDNIAHYKGGGIFQDGVEAELRQVEMANNTATGCLYRQCSVKMADGLGGGIYNNSTLDLHDSYLHGNEATIGGGAIANLTSHTTAALRMYRTTVANNVSPRGAGIYNARGRNSTASTGSGAFLYNSTISGNRSFDDYPIHDGGGLLNTEFAAIYFTTIFNNGGNGIVSAENGRVLLSHTIVAGSELQNCVGDVYSDTISAAMRPSLDDDGSCNVTITTDPLLGELSNNGGHAPTHRPHADSIVSNVGHPDVCEFGSLRYDQRWVLRERPDCGIGAVFGR